MLSSAKRFGLFSTALVRRSSSMVSPWCGLIKLPYMPLDGLNHKLNGKDAVVLIDDVLYYAEQKSKKLLLIKESVANARDYRQLKSKCDHVWRAITEAEFELIKRTLAPVPSVREDETRNESHSHNVSYSSTTSSGDVDHVYALAEERRKKELYRNYLIFDMLTDDNRERSDSQVSQSEQSSRYSNSSSHSSYSSDSGGSSDYSSSNDDSSSSYESPSCGGSSFDD